MSRTKRLLIIIASVIVIAVFVFTVRTWLLPPPGALG